MSRWCTFEEISIQLGIPVKSIYFYHECGDGPRVHKFGKHLRVLKVDYYSGKKTNLLKNKTTPFSNSSYTSNDDLFLKCLNKYHKSSDTRIQSTSQLFAAIAKRISLKVDGPDDLPTIDHSLGAHKLIEGIFNFPS